MFAQRRRALDCSRRIDCRFTDGAVRPSVSPLAVMLHPPRLTPSFHVRQSSSRYAALVAAGKIERDPGQAAALARLGGARDSGCASIGWRANRPSLGWLFGSASSAQAPIKGLYIYGDVGRGKTMLMDLFFDASAVAAQAARAFPRIHGRRARAHPRATASRSSTASRRRATRSSSPPTRSPTRPGCSASTNSMSPTSPTP